MSLAKDERAGLSDTFAEVGDNVPTLCEGWTSRDLLAHLLVRERKPWAAPGIFIPALASLADNAMSSYDDVAWPDMIEQFRDGPPVWSFTAIPAADALVNGAEHYVHHEDVRRGSPGWKPRPPHDPRDRQLWEILQRMARMLFRRSPVGVVLRSGDDRELVARKAAPSVTLVGEPGELVLFGYGRSAVEVEREGDPADVAALDGSSRGV
ncbi:MAG: TIGR03085 family metal-binding protein [Acidimicrobiales bacterium]